MATYNTLSSNQISKLLTAQFDAGVAVNTTVSDPSNGFSAAARNNTRADIFGGNQTLQAGVQYDSTGLSQTVEKVNSFGSPVSIFVEQVASTVGHIPSMTLATNGSPNLISLNTGAGINLTVTGSAGDPGDVIFGDAGTDTITVQRGNNYVVGGNGLSTIQGGSGRDTLWGGTGATAIVKGGSGDHQILRAGYAYNTDDTITGGTGSGNLLWAAYGNVDEDGHLGTGKESLISGVAGKDTMIGNGTSYYEVRGGVTAVSIIAGPNASASDTIASFGAASENITTLGGHNFITASSGNSTIASAGDDSISLINGGFDTVNASGSGSDTIQIGSAAGGDDVIHGGSSQATHIVFSADLNYNASDQTSSGGVTTVSLSGGSVIVQFSGNVTIDTNTTKNF